MYKIALDAMGGDFAPKEQVLGAMLAVKKFNDIEIHLFGDENEINKYLVAHNRIKIVHTDAEPISMGEKDPISAVRTNTKASVVMALKATKSGECDVCVSSGATQGLIAGAHMYVRRMKGFKRTAIAPVMPTVDSKGYILIDAGANLSITPEFMIQQALYAHVYAKNVLKRENPTIGLINIGEEEGKGRELDNQVYDLLKQHEVLNFIGNIEPKVILDPGCDILVSDGFTADIIMKCVEGTAKGMSSIMKNTIYKGFLGKIFGILTLGRLKKMKKTMDSSEVGGAVIYGLSKPVIKAQGASRANGILNAIRQARLVVEGDVVNKVSSEISKEV